MADHVRRQLREAVATTVTGLTTTGARVYQSRVAPLEAASLPCLLVYTTSESASPATILDQIERTVEIRVEGYAAAAADLDDTLDLIAKEVEIALGNSVTVGSKVVVLEYRGAEIEMDGEGNTERGRIALSYQARLYTAANAPDVLF